MQNKHTQIEHDEVGSKTHNIKLTNQEIVELAYITKDTVEELVSSHEKLFFEQANDYLSCYYLCRRLLKTVDPSYLDWHSGLKDFYREGRELSADWDRLAWTSTQELETLKAEVRELEERVKNNKKGGN